MKVGDERAVNTVGHEVPGRERDSSLELLVCMLVCDVLIVHVMCVRAEEPSHEAVGAAAVVDLILRQHIHIFIQQAIYMELSCTRTRVSAALRISRTRGCSLDVSLHYYNASWTSTLFPVPPAAAECRDESSCCALRMLRCSSASSLSSASRLRACSLSKATCAK